MNDRASARPATRVVLIVDDDDASRRLVAKWLTHASITTIEAKDGVEALEILKRDPALVDLVLLDVMMPGLDGFEVIRVMREDERLVHVPVIVVTAKAGDDEAVVESVSLGATDYLTKPFSGPVLLAKAERAIQTRKHEKELEKRLSDAEQQARVDPLTRLGNRQLLIERLADETAYARRHQAPLCVAMLDVDHFKQVNDSLGHAVGDLVLAHFAKLVNASIRRGDGAFRFGGEEFVIVLRACEPDAALAVTGRLRESLASLPTKLPNGSICPVTFSAGIAVANSANAFTTDDLIERADRALYQAKQMGRDRDIIEVRPSQ